MRADVTTHVDPANDTVVLVLDLVGVDAFQHEFLKQVFADRLATTESERGEVHGKALGTEDVRVRLEMKKPGAAEDARRIVAKLLTVAEEAKQKAEAAERAQLDKEAAEAKAKRDKEAADAKAAEDRAFELEKARAMGEAVGKAIAARQSAIDDHK